MTGRPGAVPSRKGWPQLQVRVSPETKERLLDAADERVIGVSLLVEHLLAEGLARLVPVDELTGGERELVALREDHPGLLEELRSRALRSVPDRRLTPGEVLDSITELPEGWHWVVIVGHTPNHHRHLVGQQHHLTRCGLPGYRVVQFEGDAALDPCARCLSSLRTWRESRAHPGG